MAANADILQIFLPFIPEYTSWLDVAQEIASRGAAAADASFASRHGAASATPHGTDDAPAHPRRNPPEQSRGALADETA